MEKDNKKSDFNSLGKSWLDKVKNIRRKARTDFEYSKELPSLAKAEDSVDDSELFAGEVNENITAKQVFAGDEHFHNFLENSSHANTGHLEHLTSKSHQSYKRLSVIQTLLIGAIAVTVVLLVYLVIKTPYESIADNEQVVEPKPEIKAVQPAVKTEAAPIGPVSLKIAHDFYLNGNYDQAIAVYKNLHDNLVNRTIADKMRDYLQLQIALCTEKKGLYKQASYIFRRSTQSQSPLVRIIASYHLSLFDMQNKDYSQSRSNAYKAICLIDSVDLTGKLADSIKRDCQFLAAAALSKKALSLYDADNDLPAGLWGKYKTINESIAELDQPQLQKLLDSGSEKLAQAVLAPDIQKVSHENGISRYSVTCRGVSFEELMARFAVEIDSNVNWNLNSESIGIRNRSIYLHLTGITKSQLVTIAAGSVGMLANITDDGTIAVSNPDIYSDLSSHVSELNDEAVSLWQSFLLTFYKDPYLANVHFTLGLLKAQRPLPNEAIAKYKIIANRFSRSSLAPAALLRMGRIKNEMNNSVGARSDLKQLVEQYPDAEITEKAYLFLARSTAEAGDLAQSATIYKKVYNISPYIKSQQIATFGAGNCFYELKDYASANKWFGRHIKLIADDQNHNSYLAYYLFGKTHQALKNSAAACNAFHHALNLEPPDKKYVEVLNALVEEYIVDKELIEAMAVLENIKIAKFSPNESTGILLLKSKVLRSMGLTDNAIGLLGDRAENTVDTQLKAKLCFEIAKCHIEKGLLDLASNQLSAILEDVAPGALANEITLELADICLKLGQDDKTILICSGILGLQPDDELKQKTLTLLSAAHSKQQNYERAALALLGQWE